MVFNLTGLVLSLSLVIVLMGFGKILKRTSEIHVGWLTPILGIWVLGDIATFWGMSWEIRDLMPSVWPSLGVGLVLTSVYYLAASLVFPDEPENEPDLDAYYWRNKRIVIGLILACNLAAFGISLALGRNWSSTVIAINALYTLGMFVALLAPGPRTSIIALLFLIAIQVWSFSTP